MACLTSARRTALIARRDKIDTQITALETAFDNAIATGNIEEYRFDSGDGSQRTKYRSIKELKDVLDELQTERDRIQRILDGTGIVSVGLRRMRGGRSGRYY